MSDTAIALEVELATKSKPRLDAILELHLGWIIAQKTNGVVYICGDEEGCRRIERAGRRVGLYPTSKHLRIELLENDPSANACQLRAGAGRRHSVGRVIDGEVEASAALERFAAASAKALGGLLLVAFDDGGDVIADCAPGEGILTAA